jgi:hypothetical protein
MKTMSCREFDEVVHGLVRMELLDVAVRETALEHAGSCNNCAERLGEAGMLAEVTAAAAESARAHEAPPAVEAALVSAFRAQHRRMSWRRRLEWATVGSVAAIVLIFVWTFPTRSKEQNPTAPRGNVSSQSKAPLDASVTAVAPVTEPAVATTADASEAFNNLANDASGFVPVPYTGGIAAEDPGMVVRVQLTRASLAQLGYPVAETPDEDLILADVLVGEDGWPRGVKLVQ